MRFYLITSIICSAAVMAVCACGQNNGVITDVVNEDVENVDPVENATCCQQKEYNRVKTENGLKLIFPNFSKMDLVCETMPS